MRENRTHGSEGGETVSSRPLSGLDHCVRYVNSKGHWYYCLASGMRPLRLFEQFYVNTMTGAPP